MAATHVTKVVQSTRPQVVHIGRTRVVHTARPRVVHIVRPSLVQYSAAGDKFKVPMGIDVDRQGNVYVVETVNKRVQKFNSDGQYIMQWDVIVTDREQRNRPESVAVSPEGDVYVGDVDAARVQKFDSSGHFINKWDFGPVGSPLLMPSDLAVDTKSNVFLADRWYQHIYEFDSTMTRQARFGERGAACAQFGRPEGIAVDTKGNLYVTDGRRVQKFTPVLPSTSTTNTKPE